MDPSAAGESASVIGSVRGSCFGGLILSYTGDQISGKRPRKAKFGQFKGRVAKIWAFFERQCRRKCLIFNIKSAMGFEPMTYRLRINLLVLFHSDL
jgi:hypothetical protein